MAVMYFSSAPERRAQAEVRRDVYHMATAPYGGADHGFTTPVGIYNERANARAWEATQVFFRETLGK